MTIPKIALGASIKPHRRKSLVKIWGGRGGVPAEAEVDSLDLSSNLVGAVAACMDDAANFRACELAKRFDGRTKSAAQAVYVMGPVDDIEVAKIGFGANPTLRLSMLQIGNWIELKIHALIWVEDNPGIIEGLTHKAATEMGLDLRGEWIAATPQEACELVLKAARYSDILVYDSETWLNNWGSRTAALAEKRKYAKRALT